MSSGRIIDGLPSLAKGLGYSGLLPQAAAVAAIYLGSPAWFYLGLSLAYAYAALILSFLGGIWWGFAALQPDRTARWLWLAAVVPSLFALATAIPWAVGAEWPGPSLFALAAAILATVLVDRRLEREGLTPRGWSSFRLRLSLGLAALTIAAAVAA